MVIETSKENSKRDPGQVLQGVYNNSGTISVDGFVSSKVGAKLTRTVVSSTIEDYRYLDVVDTQVVEVTSGSNVLQFSEDLDQLIQEGQYVFGSDIPANTTIVSLDREAKTVIMSALATGSNASETVKFANLLQRLRVQYDNSSHDNVNDVERLD